MKNLIESWHSLLNMPKHDLAWHTEDIADEFEEFKEARRPAYQARTICRYR